MGQKQRVNCVGEPVCVLCVHEMHLKKQRFHSSVALSLCTCSQRQMEGENERKMSAEVSPGRLKVYWRREAAGVPEENTCGQTPAEWLSTQNNTAKIKLKKCDAEFPLCWHPFYQWPASSLLRRLFKGLEPGQREILCVSNRMQGWEIKTEMCWSISFT